MADNLSEELLQKLKACKSVEELESLARDAGVELTDEMLQSVAGGRANGDDKCSRWHDCKNYCQLYNVGGTSDCTWVTLSRDGADLDCEYYMN